MTKPIAALLVVLLALSALASWWLRTGDPGTAAAVATERRATPAAATARQASLQASPQARTWQQRQDFEAGMRQFLREAPGLGAVERSERARELESGIDDYERANGLSAGEALLLRNGLIKATIDDEVAQAARIAELMDRYRSRADQRMRDYAREHAQDPRFRDYKAREGAIVAEVMAMQRFPDGLTRDEYLRQRLQQAREAIYR